MATPAPRSPPAIMGAAVAAAAPSELSVLAALVTVLTTLPAAFVALNSVRDIFATSDQSDCLTSVTKLPPTDVTLVPSASASLVIVLTISPAPSVTTFALSESDYTDRLVRSPYSR